MEYVILPKFAYIQYLRTSGQNLITNMTRLFLAIFLLVQIKLYAQQNISFTQKIYHKTEHFLEKDSLPNRKKQYLLHGLTGGAYLGMGAYLGGVWYPKQDLSKYHFFNDSHEWLQLDKAGHMLGGYTTASWMIDAYSWTGMPRKKAILLGGSVGMVAMSSIEVFDGFGKKWGASWSDIGANAIGVSLAMANQLLWNEYRIQRKYSYMPSIYTRKDSVAKYGDALGRNIQEWILKDYNGQVHWLSFRVHSFLPEGNFKSYYPRWLNLAVGYGGNGMIGRYCQNGDIPGGNCDPQSVIDAREYRQYYLALDIDVSNIKTKSKTLNSVLSMINMFRIPLPALEMDRFGVRGVIR